MFLLAKKTLAGILAVLLLPLAALAGSNDANASAKNAPASETTAAAAPTSTAAPAPTAAAPPGLNVTPDPLLQLLVSKGILNSTEMNSLALAPAGQMRDQLLLLLKAKGVLSAEDLNSLKVTSPAPTATMTTTAAPAMGTYGVNGTLAPTGAMQKSPPVPPGSPMGGVIPAIAPIRVLEIDPPKREGVVPLLNLGDKVHIQPYGMFKFSSLYDTSSPYGNDFPLPGFNGNINGASSLSEYHIKARFLRFGSNFEWMDSPKLVITGKIEADFEGNFSAVNNRNISSIRSPDFQLRSGYVRLDYKPNDMNSFFALFGQDWTPFTSSTLPNLFESTGLGVGFGTLFERDPQFRFGMEHNFGSFKLGPEFALVLPAYGNVAGTGSAIALQNQIGEGERQGPDSGAPELQARIVAQFQLDHAPGVVPAQIIVSGVHSNRQENVLSNGVPAAFVADFPNGVNISSSRNALSGEIQLPTRWLTVIAKYYNGTDLRYYFGGQIFSEFSRTAGLTGIAGGTTADGSGPTPFFGCIGGGAPPACAGGTAVVAPQIPPRSQGGFINIGLPLSRWANADPNGRNAGWTLYAHYGLDQVLTKDVIAEGGGRDKGRLVAGTLYYKLNKLVSFGLEESLYTTVAIPLTATGQFPLFNGRPRREWNDFRSEIGPLFTF
jgi:hypothetical protein